MSFSCLLSLNRQSDTEINKKQIDMIEYRQLVDRQIIDRHIVDSNIDRKIYRQQIVIQIDRQKIIVIQVSRYMNRCIDKSVNVGKLFVVFRQIERWIRQEYRYIDRHIADSNIDRYIYIDRTWKSKYCLLKVSFQCFNFNIILKFLNKIKFLSAKFFVFMIF